MSGCARLSQQPHAESYQFFCTRRAARGAAQSVHCGHLEGRFLIPREYLRQRRAASAAATESDAKREAAGRARSASEPVREEHRAQPANFDSRFSANLPGAAEGRLQVRRYQSFCGKCCRPFTTAPHSSISPWRQSQLRGERCPGGQTSNYTDFSGQPEKPAAEQRLHISFDSDRTKQRGAWRPDAGGSETIGVHIAGSI